ncbi:MAG: hypothetical protein AAFZ18_36890 [Myxococcota bacterium]
MDLALLELHPQQLADVAGTLEMRIREGLASDGREIKALPAHLTPPAADLAGEALVVDAGGTNVRAAHVRIGGDAGDAIVAGPASARLPVRGSGATLEAQAFYELQASLMEEAGAPEGAMPLGYCFSYPSTVHENGDATLLTWTKGVDILGVEGERVGAPLSRALAAQGRTPSVTVVLNDTVAALLGGASEAPDPARVIGLIAGTGTNMAAYFDASDAPKLAGFSGKMAVNLESGNFTPPFLTPVDDAFDATDKPGAQRFEKAVSGYALPHLYAALVGDTGGFDPSQGTGPLTEIRNADNRQGRAASALLDRSADLIAAGLYGVVRVMGGTAPVTVLAEGGLIIKAPGYAERVRKTFAALAGQTPRLALAHREDVNLYGSATAALSMLT